MAKKFVGFKPEVMQKKILPSLGYKGAMDQKSINQFLAASPSAAAMMGQLTLAAKKLVEQKPVEAADGVLTGSQSTGQIQEDPTKPVTKAATVAGDGGAAAKVDPNAGDAGAAAQAIPAATTPPMLLVHCQSAPQALVILGQACATPAPSRLPSALIPQAPLRGPTPTPCARHCPACAGPSAPLRLPPWRCR